MSKFTNSVGGAVMTLAQKVKRNAYSWEQFFAVEKRKITEAVENHVIGGFSYQSENFWKMFQYYVGTPYNDSLLSVSPDGLVLDSQYEYGMKMFQEWLDQEGLGMELIIDEKIGQGRVLHMFVFITY